MAALPSFGAELSTEEIVVTTRKRVDRLADVPQTVTLLSGNEIAAHDIRLSPDLARQVPNLMWHSILGLATPQIFLRGIGNATFNANQANPVGIHTDGIYQGSNLTYGFGLFDLERVEVLKGPQGTLFGRNTTGGVIDFVTRKPDVSDGTNGYARATYGRFSEGDGEAAVGFAAGPHLAARLSGQILTRDGYLANHNPAATSAAAGRLRLWSGRAQVRLQDFESFDLLLNVHGARNRSDVPGGKQIGALCPPTVRVPQPGDCTDFDGFRDTANPREHFANVPSRDFIDSAGGSATATWHLDVADLVSQTAFEGNHRRLVNDSDAGPFPAVKTSVASHFHLFSEELRVVSRTVKPVGWTVGANYYADRLNADQDFTLNAFGPGPLTHFFPVDEGIASRLIQGTRSFAAFGEAYVAATDRLTLTGGVRWTSDRRTADTNAFIFDATGLGAAYTPPALAATRVLVPTIPPTSLSRTWNEWSGRGIAAYRIDDATLAYASISRGFKGGDFNGGALFAPAEATIADPEYVTAYEVGMKGSLPAAALTYSVAGFHYDFTNQQVAVLVPGSRATLQSLANAAKTRVNGLEAEVDARPLPHLQMTGRAGWVDSKFARFQLDASNSAVNYDGNRTVSSPPVTLYFSGRYDIPLGRALLALEADTSYTGAHYFTVDNNPSLRQGGYWLANARVALDVGQASVALWVKNIGDRAYYVSGLGNAGLGFLELIPALPRTFGVSLEARF